MLDCLLFMRKSWFQWLSNLNGNKSHQTASFTISFNIIRVALSCIQHSGTPSDANTVYSVSVSSIGVGSSYGGTGRYLIAIGQ